MRIDRMINQIKKFGVFSPNRYLIELGGMVGMADLMMMNRLSLMCTNCQVPSRSIASAPETNFSGGSRQIPYDPLWPEEISMTFYLAKDMWERRIFETWMDMIVDPTTGRFGYYKDYVCDGFMYVLNEFSLPIYKIRLEEMWPKQIGEIELTNEGGQEIAKQTISFAFYDYVPEILTFGAAVGEELLYDISAIRDLDSAVGGLINDVGILGGKYGNPLNMSQVFDKFASDGRVVTQAVSKANIGSLGQWL